MPDRAISSYTHAVDLNPKNEESIINRGLAYCDIGNFKKAISSFKDAEDKTGDPARLCYFKGNAYNKAKKYDEAINCYDQAIKSIHCTKMLGSIKAQS